MSFLQSWIWWALPLAALPVIIHLIHRRRHRVVEWGAMMFLLEGARMSRGRQRLREILLLTLRTLAILGLLIGVGRPIAGGWVARFGGADVDTIVLVVDRSASMSESLPGRTDSKLAFGVARIQEALRLSPAKELVVVDATRPFESLSIDGPDAIDAMSLTTPTAAVSDMAAALETAASLLEEGGAGRSELWVLSDAQTNDWRPEDGRWQAVATRLGGHEPAIRTRLSTFPTRADDNLAVRVERVRREAPASPGEPAHLVLDVVVTRSTPGTQTVVPVAIETGGARSVVEVELTGAEARLQGHRVPVDAALETGHGVVTLTADSRPADDRFFFVFGEAPPLETVVVRERADVGRVVQIAAELPMARGAKPVARQLEPDALTDLASDLSKAALLVWQAPLPVGDHRDAIDGFVSAGGHVLFLPPDRLPPEGASYRGLEWGAWTTPPGDGVPDSWRTDDDLWRTGDDGTPLPVGELEVRRRRPILESGDPSNDFTGAHLTLASLSGPERVLVRATGPVGGTCFLGFLPSPDSSNLASQGVILVATIQRALVAASAERGSDLQRNAGEGDWSGGAWLPVDGSLFERGLHAGVLANGDSFVALNRPASEDASPPLPLESVEALFEGVDVVATEASADSAPDGLLEEVWRVFLGLAVIALIAEALLCISEGGRRRAKEASE